MTPQVDAVCRTKRSGQVRSEANVDVRGESRSDHVRPTSFAIGPIVSAAERERVSPIGEHPVRPGDAEPAVDAVVVVGEGSLVASTDEESVTVWGPIHQLVNVSSAEVSVRVHVGVNGMQLVSGTSRVESSGRVVMSVVEPSTGSTVRRMASEVTWPSP